MHPADIKAALAKKGLTLSDVSRKHGYHPTSAGRALRTPWPQMETIIATELGFDHPQDIWPERYENGVSIRYLPRSRK